MKFSKPQPTVSDVFQEWHDKKSPSWSPAPAWEMSRYVQMGLSVKTGNLVLKSHNIFLHTTVSLNQAQPRWSWWTSRDTREYGQHLSTITTCDKWLVLGSQSWLEAVFGMNHLTTTISLNLHVLEGTMHSFWRSAAIYLFLLLTFDPEAKFQLSI